MKKKTLYNIFFVLSKTWKYERPIILIIFLQVISGVLVPLISIYLPSTMLNSYDWFVDKHLNVLNLTNMIT
ncbi:hypothetical protein GCM10023142_32930 [Anaerocolumna aminovalerica]|jgi:hypothetical protein|uniref:Uncharacterized protein n=1 Tax=Anaerocolumna aminovalerica TaxID=1527 RepID=A0A1I5EB01_9FIRM|nr:hypothetical protein [Anaerocolumna aminovalerica]MBU5330724.1 hypothetical protein [Anaerocolumna aminovalerica]MDU6263295.1 hypothetical protein [Anaerocolumna aminovalerica]SFO08503.1 hypothetical protein SAMN04489757_108126 [Anaerocolumna aminovalerica]